MKKYYAAWRCTAWLFSLLITLPTVGWGQVSLTASGTTITVDFESTLSGVNNGPFAGSGFAPTPAAGQLDSDAWAVDGLSNGTLDFGETETSGDFARGLSPVSVSTGGIYAFDVGDGNVILGVQPGGSDFTPGKLTLRLQNNTGSLITELTVSYDIFVFNDQSRGNSFDFSYSDDDATYTDVSALDYTTPGAADPSPAAWISVPRSTDITGLNISDGSFFYLEWSSDDEIGSGSRDEFGIDNIEITPVGGGGGPDIIPPVFVNSTPFVDNETSSGFTLTAALDEPGITYYVVLPDGASAPNASEVIARTDGDGNAAIVSDGILLTTANASEEALISSLSVSTAYDVYVVAEDDETPANVQTNPVLVEVTTTGATQGNPQLIRLQSFDAVDDGQEWGFVNFPDVYNASGDVWDIVGSVVSISPDTGTAFWGMRDLDNPNGGGAFFHALRFDTIDLFGLTDVSVQFGTNVFGFDIGDEMDYVVTTFTGGVATADTIIILAPDALNQSTVGAPGAYQTFSYNIPDGIDSVALTLRARQDGGGDYAGWDNIQLRGTNVADTVSFANGDYRSVSGGTWGSGGTATWEQFDGTSFQPSSQPPTSASAARVFVVDEITSVGGLSDVVVLVLNGGTLNVDVTDSFDSLTVALGGTLRLEAPFSASSPLWNGTERFADGSTVVVENWDYSEDFYSGQISPNADGFVFGNLELDVNPTEYFELLATGSGAVNFVQNDLIVRSTGNATGFGVSPNPNPLVAGDLILEAGSFAAFATSAAGTGVARIGGNLTLNGGDFNINQTSSGNFDGRVRVGGDLTVASGATLLSSDAGCFVVFNGGGAPQGVTIEGTVGSNVDFRVANADSTARVVLQTDFPLPSSTNSLTVTSDGTLDFNGFNVTGAGTFALSSGGEIVITSPEGITIAGPAGNVQTTTRNYAGNGTYRYVGAGPGNQFTGDGLVATGGAKTVVVDAPGDTVLLSTPLPLQMGGGLEIIAGVFSEDVTPELDSNLVTGSGASLTMTGGEYIILNSEETVPVFEGTDALNLTGGAINLQAGANQVLRGGRDYATLIFGGGNSKTITSAIPNVDSVVIDDVTELNVENNTFGNAGTDLRMRGSAILRVAGSGVRPNMGGSYDLNANSTIIFENDGGVIRQQTYNDIVVLGPDVRLNGTVTLQDGATFLIGVELTPGGLAGQFATDENAVIQGGAGTTFEVATGAAFAYGHPDGFNADGLTGVVRTETITADELASYGFVGTASQVSGTALPLSVANLSIDKIPGADVTLTQNLEVGVEGALGAGTGIFFSQFGGTGGRLILDGNNLALKPNAIILGANENAHVVTDNGGLLERFVPDGGGNFEFPVGFNPYLPVTLSLPTGGSFYGVAVQDNVVTNPAADSGQVFTDSVVTATWRVVRLSGTATENVEITFQWPTAEEGTGFDRNDSYIAVNVADSLGFRPLSIPNAASAGLSAGTFLQGDTQTYAGGNDFYYTVVSGLSNPLPVELRAFGGEVRGGAAYLTWQTATELNNDGFAVERSPDGETFREIAYVRGAGTTNQAQRYAYTDRTFGGTAYYRLRQVDFDGRTAYSNTIRLTDARRAPLRVYPNPTADGRVTVEWAEVGATERVTLTLRSATGGTVWQATAPLAEATAALQRALATRPTGMYWLELRTVAGVRTVPLSKQ